MAKSSTEIFGDKIDKIDSIEKSLKKSYTSAERWLLARIIDEIIPELDVEDGGVIKNTQGNIDKITSKLNAAFTALRTGKNREIVDGMLKDFSSVSKLNSRYFGAVTDLNPTRFGGVKSSVEEAMKRSLGFDTKGRIIPNSFIDTVSKNDAVNQTLREQAIKSIQGGNTVKEFTDELRTQIVTNENGLGALNSHYGPVVGDRYAQYDRAESKQYADAIGMKAFIYSGGKVQDTRKFCCQRNGLVFTTEESQEWSSLRFQGKNKGYVPIIDMGGYNCRHSPQWISNRAAARRREDLVVNDEGDLVYKDGEPTQKLHRC